MTIDIEVGWNMVVEWLTNGWGEERVKNGTVKTAGSN